MRRLALLLALVLAAPAWAADEIKGPDTVPVHQLATVTTDVEADGFIWLAFPLETTFAADQASPKVLQFAGMPGAHQVVLIPLRGGKPAGQYRKTVTFGADPTPPPGPSPDPAPGPTPDPAPPPAPAPPAAFVTLVLDLDAGGRPDVAAIRTSPAVRSAAADLKLNFGSYDDDAEAVKAKNLLPYVAKAGGVPALIFQAADGNVLASLPCPPTPEGVVDLMKNYRKAGGAE